MQTHPGIAYQFGPFEVNAASGDLLKHGIRVKLQEQPFRLLVVLLESPGELVSREELRRRIWPENTFVDFDGSLRVAVRKLREALGDDAEHPQYVETVPKRGYRFLAPVAQRGDVGPIAHVPPGQASPTKPAAPPRSRPSPWIVSATFLLIAIVAVAPSLFPRSRKVLTERDTVVLADFANSTGDPVFNGTLRQGLEVQLEQSPFLNLISDERARQELQLMGQPADAPLTPRLAQEVCVRTGSTVALDGSIAKLGSQYVLGLDAKNCHTGAILTEQQMQVARKEDVLNAVSQMAAIFRTEVGESQVTVEKHNTPLAEATTPSLEALKAYSLGWKVAGTGSEEAAEPFFRNAAQMDPKFAMAYASLALMYGSTGESVLATENIGKAWQLRERASDNEKFFITAYYDGRATGNQQKAQQTSETWAQVYTRNPIPHAMLSGFIYPAFGKYQQAGEAAEKAIQIDPDFAMGYVNLGYACVYLDRPFEAEKALRRASQRGIEAPYLSLLRYDVAFLEDEEAEMERQMALAQGKSGTQDWILDHSAFALAYTGHLQESRRMSQRAFDIAQSAGHRERAALFQTRVALREAFFGNARLARRNASAALALSSNREVQYGAAIALALAGDSAQAQRLADNLEASFPEDTAIRFSYLPSLRAFLAIKHGDPAKAKELLDTAVLNELGQPRSAVTGYFGALYPIYARGQAYLAAGQGPQAAKEFHKILDHRGAVVVDPISVLAHLQLARAYALSGDRPRANIAYREFLALWKDADRDIPILKQARAEYAKLN